MQDGHKNAKMLRYQYHTYFTTFSSVCAQKVRQENWLTKIEALPSNQCNLSNFTLLQKEE